MLYQQKLIMYLSNDCAKQGLFLDGKVMSIIHPFLKMEHWGGVHKLLKKTNKERI